MDNFEVFAFQTIYFKLLES